MIDLSLVSARGSAARGLARPVLTDVTLRAERGVLAIVGAARDGTSLLFGVIDRTARPARGKVAVEGSVARVAMDAPLPESLRVDEVCRLEAELRFEAPRPAAERLAVVGAGQLAARSVGSLGFEERRAVALALALTSTASVLLLEEPLAAIDPAIPSAVVAAVRAKAAEAAVVITTASMRDAKALGDRLGVLSAGVYRPLVTGTPDAAGLARVRIVLASPEARAALALASALGEEDGVTALETSAGDTPGRIVASGTDYVGLARAVTRAIAKCRVDVASVERGCAP